MMGENESSFNVDGKRAFTLNVPITLTKRVSVLKDQVKNNLWGRL
jgi:hypothetical protein